MTALFTLLDDKFFPGFVAFIKSLKKHHPDLDMDFIILDVGLSNEIRETVKNLYPRVIIRKPRTQDYRDVDMSKTDPRLRATYYTLDAFCQYDYDRIIAIDMDIVILGDISEVLNCKAPFAAVKGYDARRDEFWDDINSGVFVIGKEYLNEETYRGLLQIAKRGHSMPDQKTINAYFRGKIAFFNKKYNVEKRMLYTKKHKAVLEDIRMLHFVALKPWEKHNMANAIENSFQYFEKIWWDIYNG